MVVLHNILIDLSNCNAKRTTRAGSFLHAVAQVHQGIQGMDERLRTIELSVKLGSHQTQVRLRYSTSRANNESRPDNMSSSLH